MAPVGATGRQLVATEGRDEDGVGVDGACVLELADVVLAAGQDAPEVGVGGEVDDAQVDTQAAEILLGDQLVLGAPDVVRRRGVAHAKLLAVLVAEAIGAHPPAGGIEELGRPGRVVGIRRGVRVVAPQRRRLVRPRQDGLAVADILDHGRPVEPILQGLAHAEVLEDGVLEVEQGVLDVRRLFGGRHVGIAGDMRQDVGLGDVQEPAAVDFTGAQRVGQGRLVGDDAEN